MRPALVVLCLVSVVAAREPELVPTRTPWPAALPCERFAAAEFYITHDAELIWSGARGSRRFPLRRDAGSHDPVEVPLDAGFAVGAFDRVELRALTPAGPRELSLGIHLMCRADEPAGVWWGQGAEQGLSVLYQRTAPSRDLLPAILAERADALTGARAAELTRFAGEVVTRAATALSDACSTTRCAKPVQLAADRLGRLRAVTWKTTRVKSASEEVFAGMLQHRGWSATLSAPDAALTLDCGTDIPEARATQTDLHPRCGIRVTDHGRPLVDGEATLQCERFPVDPSTRCLWAHRFHFHDGTVEVAGNPTEKTQLITITGDAVATRP